MSVYQQSGSQLAAHPLPVVGTLLLLLGQLVAQGHCEVPILLPLRVHVHQRAQQLPLHCCPLQRLLLPRLRLLLQLLPPLLAGLLHDREGIEGGDEGGPERVPGGEVLQLDAREQPTQVVPAGVVGLLPLNAAQREGHFSLTHSLSVLLACALGCLAGQEEAVGPGGVVEAVLLDHVLCEAEFLLPRALLLDEAGPEAPGVVVLVVDALDDVLGDVHFPLGVEVVVEEEALLLPDLEGLGLFAEAAVGEVELVKGIHLGRRQDVPLLAVPGVVVAGLLQQDLLGQAVGGRVEHPSLHAPPQLAGKGLRCVYAELPAGSQTGEKRGIASLKGTSSIIIIRPHPHTAPHQLPLVGQITRKFILLQFRANLYKLTMSTTFDDPIEVHRVPTAPIEGQKPGTSGLRKKVSVFQQPHYVENFIQSYFNALPKDVLAHHNSLLVGGDGRYLTPEVVSTVARVACANGIDELHVAQGGLMSTPACSAYIRNLNATQGNCIGGVLLTASHNPGGPHEDFGIKFNSRNGGPAQEEFTNLVFSESAHIAEYSLASVDFLQRLSLDKPGEYLFTNVARPSKPHFLIRVVENVGIYVELMRQLFDFDAIRGLLQREDFRMVFDAMYGAAGPYAKAIFGLLSDRVQLRNCDPRPDFNGMHPDPNLECGHELVELMGYRTGGEGEFDFGAACDGDADRNMILGRKFFVTPSDSLAVLASLGHLFLKEKLTGVARSMPTSGAVDKVATKLGINVYETPTGWKFFGNLMEAGLIGLCGEESFGTGSPHIREKDGLWTILAWLQVLARSNEGVPVGQLVGVRTIVERFWAEFGRNYYSRYDFENVETSLGNKVWAHLLEQVPKYKEGEVVGSVFEYHDPVDKSHSKNQGLIFRYQDGSRVIFRQSGTGSVGITLRIYFEKYEPTNVLEEREQVLKGLIAFGLDLSQVLQISQKAKPDVIT